MTSNQKISKTQRFQEHELMAQFLSLGIKEAPAKKAARAVIVKIADMPRRLQASEIQNVFVIAVKGAGKRMDPETQVCLLPGSPADQNIENSQNIGSPLSHQHLMEHYISFESILSKWERAFLSRSEKASPRWNQLVNSITSILTSSDQSDLEALENFLSDLRKKEQKELISQFKSMAFLNDHPLSKQARIHAEFQKAISEEFQLYTPTELGIKLGVKKQSARQKIFRWINSGDLFTVQDGKELVPEFEIDWESKKPNKLIKKTIGAFPEKFSGWAIAYWMCQANELLNGFRPVDVMNERPDDYLYALKGRKRGATN